MLVNEHGRDGNSRVFTVTGVQMDGDSLLAAMRMLPTQVGKVEESGPWRGLTVRKIEVRARPEASSADAVVFYELPNKTEEQCL